MTTPDTQSLADTVTKALQTWPLLERNETRSYDLLITSLIAGAFFLAAVIASFVTGFWKNLATMGPKALWDVPGLLFVIALVPSWAAVYLWLSTFAPQPQVHMRDKRVRPGDKIQIAWRVEAPGRWIGPILRVEMELRVIALVQESTDRFSTRTEGRREVIRKVPVASVLVDGDHGLSEVTVPANARPSGAPGTDGIIWVVHCQEKTRWWPEPEDDFVFEVAAKE